jgi:Arc/MetJ-type ribon-helix-helix transcriptional regulator
VRIPEQTGAAITAWIERQPEPKPSRSEAIRRLIDQALQAR